LGDGLIAKQKVKEAGHTNLATPPRILQPAETTRKKVSTSTKISKYKITLWKQINLPYQEPQKLWPLTRKDENMLPVFERRTLRKIYGLIKENNIWRSRYNHELY
jgi:hypothetical protein